MWVTYTCAGIDCDVVPGLDDQGEKVDGDSELSPRCRGYYSECGVGGTEPWGIGEIVEPERFDRVAFRAPTDPYADFAFVLDGATQGGSESGSLVAAELEHLSALETIRYLEFTIGPPRGEDATADSTPTDFDTMLSKAITKCPSPGECEIQCLGQPNGNPLNPFPFQLSTSTSSFSALVPPSPSLPPAVSADTAHKLVSTNSDLRSLLDTPTEVMPGIPRISATVSNSGMSFECAETASGPMNLDLVEVQEEVIAGPRLFQLLDDSGME